ncbi:MAG: hypothetical protein ONB44_19355 [candidate division KSB1 bacterium]|nr:hypothetical protein [candidate division KSB1 bacterium]MDZ7304287.1 hypothetical protein [candidate division KSB1 bacterium]MDZ7312914.1 hypothetical protein [candidate division KSB1 bacterium]
MAEVLTDQSKEISQTTPTLRLPDASSAREAVGRWLLREIGTGVYPGEATFLPDSFTWHVPVWLSYPEKTQIGVLADIYLHAASGAFMGRPSREELIHRAEVLLKKMG